MTNHNRCWIWGRNVVMETLRANRWPIIELFHSDRCEAESRRFFQRGQASAFERSFAASSVFEQRACVVALLEARGALRLEEINDSGRADERIRVDTRDIDVEIDRREVHVSLRPRLVGELPASAFVASPHLDVRRPAAHDDVFLE